MQNARPAQDQSTDALQRATLVYFVIPLAFAVLFGWHRTAIPADLPRLYSIVAWICILVPTWLAYDAAAWAAAKLSALRTLPLWCLLLLSALCASALINPLLVWISEFVFRINVPPMPDSPGPYILTFLSNVAPFVGLWVGVNLLFVHQIGLSRFGYHQNTSQAVAKTTDGAFGPSFDAALLALSAEDHYVRLYFPDGSELVRMKFADALTAVAPRKGLRVHRSHWVAIDAVVGVEQSGRQCTLTLSNGLKIPVSRSYRVAVSDAGLQ